MSSLFTSGLGALVGEVLGRRVRLQIRRMNQRSQGRTDQTPTSVVSVRWPGGT